MLRPVPLRQLVREDTGQSPGPALTAAENIDALPRPARRRFWAIVVAGFLVSFILELRVLPENMDDFRDTQTAISAFWMKHEGISFLDYQTPIFGPPWRAPMEFPLHQVLTAVLSTLSGSRVHIASRIVSLISFEISAVFVVLIALRLYRSHAVALAALLFYLFVPYTMFYAIYGLMDHLALALTLGYLYFAWVWIELPSRRTAFAAGLLCGVLAAVVKVTTIAIVGGALPLIVLITLIDRWRQASTTSLRLIHVMKNEAWTAVGIVALAIVPFLAVSLWTAHADAVKDVNVHTRFLTSGQLHNFIYGTWEWKTDPAAWQDLAKRFQYVLVPGAVAVLPVAGLFLSWRHGWRSGVLTTTLLLSCPVVIFTFFSLFRHDYYFISMTPIVAWLVGVAAAEIVGRLGRNPIVLATVALPFIIPLLPGWPKVSTDYDWAGRDPVIRALSDATRYATPPDEWVVSDQRERGWSPSLLFRAERKGFILDDGGSLLKYNGADVAMKTMLANPRFTTVVGLRDVGDLAREHWKHADVVFDWRGAYAYKVSNDPHRMMKRLVPTEPEQRSTPGRQWRIVEPIRPECLYRVQVVYTAENLMTWRFNVIGTARAGIEKSVPKLLLDYQLVPGVNTVVRFALSPPEPMNGLITLEPENGVGASSIQAMIVETIGCAME
jgi:hypothetical protein